MTRLFSRFFACVLALVSILAPVHCILADEAKTAAPKVITEPNVATESNVSAMVSAEAKVTAGKCVRQSDYDIYLSGIHTGTMSRTETWQGKTAVVSSHSKASILGIGTEYRQRAELSWSMESDEWLTNKFHQQVSGFRARDMQATFSDNGRDSKVDLDGDIEHYHSDNIALRDVDTLAIQMRHYLLQGRQQFALIRQASDAIEPYQYYVQAAKTVNLAPWGELVLVPVEQTGAEEVTYYFAPELDYQLVQARYHGILLQGLIALNHHHSTCL